METKKVGSRAEVFHGAAEQTAGGLRKKDLYRGKDGGIHSKKMKSRGSNDALVKWREAVRKVSEREGVVVTPDKMKGALLKKIRAQYKKMMA